mgnify:CR=1 FL=1|jgi:Mn-dependent DtxR family transcriptional regulator
MPNQKQSLTATNIKYLLAVHELGADGKGVRCIDIAGRLNVAKSTVHATIEMLCGAGMVSKRKNSVVYLTDAGHEKTAQYAACFAFLFHKMHNALGLSEEECRSATYAVLGQKTEDGLSELYSRLNDG